MESEIRREEGEEKKGKRVGERREGKQGEGGVLKSGGKGKQDTEGRWIEKKAMRGKYKLKERGRGEIRRLERKGGIESEEE